MVRNRNSGNPDGAPLLSVTARRNAAIAAAEDAAAIESDALADTMAYGSFAQRAMRDEAAHHRRLAAAFRKENAK